MTIAITREDATALVGEDRMQLCVERIEQGARGCTMAVGSCAVLAVSAEGAQLLVEGAECSEPMEWQFTTSGVGQAPKDSPGLWDHALGPDPDSLLLAHASAALYAEPESGLAVCDGWTEDGQLAFVEENLVRSDFVGTKVLISAPVGTAGGTIRTIRWKVLAEVSWPPIERPGQVVSCSIRPVPTSTGGAAHE